MSTPEEEPVHYPTYYVDVRLVHVLSSFVGLCLLGLGCWCALRIVHKRNLRRILNDPRHIALARLKEEAENGPPTPVMKTVSVEATLRTGWGPEEWHQVMPLGLERQSDSSLPLPSYSKEREDEAKTVQLSVLVALPSPLRRQCRKNNGFEPITVDSQSIQAGRYDTAQYHFDYHQIPEVAVGIYKMVFNGDVAEIRQASPILNPSGDVR